VKTKRIAAWILAPLVVAAGGCASTSTPPTPTSTVSVAGTKAGGGSGPGAPAGNERVRALVELDSLRREVATLRDQVEVQEHELDKLKKRQRELYDDLDYRLRARERVAGGGPVPRQPGGMGQPGMGQPGMGQPGMEQPGMPQPGVAQMPPEREPGALAAGGAPSMPGGEPPQEQQPPSQTMPENPPMAAPPVQPEEQPGLATAPAVPAPTAPTQVAVATAAEQAAYDSAFEMLKQGRYGEAIAAFENILAQYPNGALADDSNYWIGEAWYVTRDYERALDIFKQVVARYPDSPRVPEALLKIGYVQNEVGAKAEACRTFSQVINRYPGSRVAISAQTRRKRLELDGHCPG